MITDDGGPAFPRPASIESAETSERILYGERASAGQDGMSLRDWFAGKALTGILSNGDIMQACVDVSKQHELPAPVIVAETAVRYADAMLHALAVPQEERKGG